jgi:hypothetical protein
VFDNVYYFTTSEKKTEEEVVEEEKQDEEIEEVPAISLVLALISIGIIAIFRRK